MTMARLTKVTMESIIPDDKDCNVYTTGCVLIVMKGFVLKASFVLYEFLSLDSGKSFFAWWK